MLLLTFMLFLTLLLAYKAMVQIWSFANKLRISSMLENIHTRYDLQDISYKDFPLIMAEVFKRKGYKVKITDKCGEEGNGLVLDDKLFVEVWKNRFNHALEVETAMKLAKCMQNQKVYRGMLVTSGEFKQNTRMYCHKNVITCINGDQFLIMLREVQRDRAGYQIN